MDARPSRNHRRPERNRSARTAILPGELGDGQEHLSERPLQRQNRAFSGQRRNRRFFRALWFTALAVGFRLAMQGADSRWRHRRFLVRTESAGWERRVLRNGSALTTERRLARSQSAVSGNPIHVSFVSQTVRNAA